MTLGRLEETNTAIYLTEEIGYYSERIIGMKIALLGYGNMGKEVEKLVQTTEDAEIISISYRDSAEILDKEGIQQADVVIDFTSAEITLHNIREILPMKKNMVIGTTGWYQQLHDVENLVLAYKTGLVYGGNFSIGANIFFQMVAYSSKLFYKYRGYDVYGFEIHHAEKKDSPSGTAKTLASILMENFPTKSQFQFDRVNRRIQNNELHLASLRGGYNPGRHEVIFDSMADEITLTHSARSRQGFAQGALLAAKFIDGKQGLYRFEDIFEENRDE